MSLDAGSLFEKEGSHTNKSESEVMESFADEVADVIKRGIDEQYNVDWCKNELGNFRLSRNCPHSEVIENFMPDVFQDIKLDIETEGLSGQAIVKPLKEV